jgi:hypothetical protein
MIATGVQNSFKKLAVASISFVIATFLVLQAVAGFAPLILDGPAGHRTAAVARLFSNVYLVFPPMLWPFLDYPMYCLPHHKGDALDRYFVFGTLEDSTEVPIFPEDLGLHFWQFYGQSQQIGVVVALLRENNKLIKTYVELYQSRHNKRLLGLRLENHPLILSREGANPGPRQVLKRIQFNTINSEQK